MEDVMTPAQMDALKDGVENLYFGRFDLGGAPYIRHLQRVSAVAEDVTGSPIVGLLGLSHDVVEDGLCGFEDVLMTVKCWDFVDDLHRLTRRRGEHRSQYLRRVLESEHSAVVKYIDLFDNSDLSRLNRKPNANDRVRIEIYQRDMVLIRTKGLGICQSVDFHERVCQAFESYRQLPARL